MLLPRYGQGWERRPQNMAWRSVRCWTAGMWTLWFTWGRSGIAKRESLSMIERWVERGEIMHTFRNFPISEFSGLLFLSQSRLGLLGFVWKCGTPNSNGSPSFSPLQWARAFEDLEEKHCPKIGCTAKTQNEGFASGCKPQLQRWQM